MNVSDEKLKETCRVVAGKIIKTYIKNPVVINNLTNMIYDELKKQNS